MFFLPICKQQQPRHVSSLTDFKVSEHSGVQPVIQSSSHLPPVPEGLVSWYSISGKNSAMEDVILVICAARELRFFWQIFDFERMGDCS